ncbi:MAG: CoA activase, partial [Firmicutes bacterium]|nr:CoA activase [Bacillota bacterium]
MYYTGIDIGSTASKVVVLDEQNMIDHFVIPTGWSSKETAMEIAKRLEAAGYPVGDANKVLATGYGRISVDYASKV